ncbi:MAG TPA: indolepyruvate ferredoxin oxidoreductase family protein [Ramlibacter sp.]|nr:indolepyruvate ferredoxin oxidoreductase family protein [Ramlibacter sp.]
MNAMTEARFLTTLEDRYTTETGRIYLNGMQALLRLLLDQRRLDARRGLNTAGFVSGYPGSPVGGVDDVMLENKALLDAHQIVFQPGLNEELAATAVFGTQTLHAVPGAKYDGVFGLWYGKSPGVDRAADALHHANFRGVDRNGGVLVVAGDDPHARSTIYPSDSNLAFASFYMPVLAPGSIQEVLDFGLHGYALSRASGLWVGFKLVTDVADSGASVEVGPHRVQPVLPKVLYGGQELGASVLVNEAGPPLLEAERRIHDGRLEIVREYARLNGLNRIVVDPPDARIGLMTGGKTYHDLRQALLNLGLDEQVLHERGIRILKMGLLYPVEPSIVREFARGLEEIVVIEDKRPLLELFLKDLLYPWPQRPVVVGKTDEEGAELLTAAGELSADAIAAALVKRLTARGLQVPRPPAPPQKAAAPVIPLAALPGRTPYFCSGCPHNRSLHVPEGSVVGAGIGCHIMTLWMGGIFGEVKGYTQMGGEGAQWIGLAPFTDTKHFFQNLGDGTFHHSGSLAIRAAIAANVNITYKVLYNRAVAMTGGQDVTGAMSVPRMAEMLRAEGVKRIIVTTDEPERYPGRRAGGAEVWHRDRLVEAEQQLAATAGVTVLINDQQCAAEKRRLRKRGKLADRPKAAFINERVCEGCGDCGAKSNCLSVQPVATEFGRKTQIHQSSCNQDFSCLDGDCPSFLTVQTLDGQRPRPARKAALEFPADVQLPEPQPLTQGPYFNAGLVGIGGTGVVTVNQVLGMAAFLDGLQVQTYDHTGSSQKAGPVVSHLKIYPAGATIAPTVSAGQADLYLAFDALGAVNPANLAMASTARTVAVVSSSKVPTGDMVSNVARSYPAQAELARRIDAVTRRDRNLYFDAQGLAERLLGDHMANNLLMVGVAWQLGALPISAQAIEAAIRLNGTAVKMNLEAFRWGRLQAADPERVERLLADAAAPAPAAVPARVAELLERAIPQLPRQGELRRVLAQRMTELVAYQDEAYALRYLQFVRSVIEARPDDGALALAVGRNLYKLMAYKDEYEVARLHLAAEAQAQLAGAFGQKVRTWWHFHPTFLRALGVKKKVRVGSWFRPALQLLRGLKGLRGTPLDLLGRTRVRRIERELPAFYMALVQQACTRPGAAPADLLALAELPDLVRGYEDVKLRNVARFLDEAQGLQQRLGLGIAPGPALATQLRAA